MELSAQFRHKAPLWGTTYDNVVRLIPQNASTTLFSPKQRPDYSNKIMSFITAIDENYMDKIKIMRVTSDHLTDYLFVNDKLYSTLDEWSSISEKSIRSIEGELDAAHGQSSTQQDENLTIVSYNDKTSKILLYKRRSSDGKWDCKLYYYAKNLFKMLILE